MDPPTSPSQVLTPASLPRSLPRDRVQLRMALMRPMPPTPPNPDSADEATASSEEESADGVDACGLHLPARDGPYPHSCSSTSALRTLSASSLEASSRSTAWRAGAPDGGRSALPAARRRGPVMGRPFWLHVQPRRHLLEPAFSPARTPIPIIFDNADDIIRKFRLKVIFSPEYLTSGSR